MCLLLFWVVERSNKEVLAFYYFMPFLSNVKVVDLV